MKDSQASGGDIALTLFLMAMALALVISSIAWPITWYHLRFYQTMVDGGYEEVVKPTQFTKVWAKREGKE